jgi:transcriptional regulator with XRE-family HTH domain
MDMAVFDLNYKYYQRLESGQVNPTLFTLYKVAIALKISIPELLRSASEQSCSHDAADEGGKA